MLRQICHNPTTSFPLGIGLTEQHKLAAFAYMLYIAIGYKNKENMKVAVSNINIKIHQLFYKQCILGVRVNIVQLEIFVDLTRTCF